MEDRHELTFSFAMKDVSTEMSTLSIVADLMDNWTRLENHGYINRHHHDREEIQMLRRQLQRCRQGLDAARYNHGVLQREMRDVQNNFDVYVEAYQQLWRFIDEIMHEQPDLRHRYATRLLPMAADEISNSESDTNTQRTLVFESDSDSESTQYFELGPPEIIDLTTPETIDLTRDDE